MPAPPSKKRRPQPDQGDVIRAVTTPLGFFVLALLIVESALTLVLTCSNLSEEHKWAAFQMMIFVSCGMVLLVFIFSLFKPKNLLYGKEEHANPALERSALRDQMEDLIMENVRPESLKNRPE